MSNIKKNLSILGVLFALISCTCATPLVVSEIQKSDKKLTCKDIILEINESEHYKDLAKNERGIGFGNALMPVCWVSSYVDASKAVDAANARVAYLGKIYDVLDCGGKSDRGDRSDAGGVPGMMPPPFIQVQPAQQPQPQQQYGQPRAYQQQAPLQRQKQYTQQPQQQQQMQAQPQQQMQQQQVKSQAPAEEEEVTDTVAVKGERDIDDQMVRKESHQHIDRFGKVYNHSHPYAGPHRHPEDQ